MWEGAARWSTQLHRGCWVATGLSRWMGCSDPQGPGHGRESINPAKMKLCPGCHNPFTSNKLYKLFAVFLHLDDGWFGWHRATETYVTERFVTALEAAPQVYIRILNTISSLGKALLRSGTLIPKLVKPMYKYECIVTCIPGNEQTLQYPSTQSQSKMRLYCSVQRIRKNINNLTASKQAPITLLDLLHLSTSKCIFFLKRLQM